jgi:hypothetical protein
MKKLLIIVMITLVTILTIITVINGLQIGGLTILGITGMKDKNAQLETQVEQATKLASTDFPNKVTSVNESIKKLQKQRQDYEDMVTVSTDSQVQSANQFDVYPIEYLWTQIGKHAKREGVVMKMDVVKGSTNTKDTYNLSFTATGSYIGITDFISDIEDDSSLGFKIEEFKMVPSGNNNELQATFTCKEITIKGISASTVSTPDANSQKNTAGENATNNTTSNTTNSTNTNTNTTNTNTAGGTTNTTNTTNTATTTQ